MFHCAKLRCKNLDGDLCNYVIYVLLDQFELKLGPRVSGRGCVATFTTEKCSLLKKNSPLKNIHP